MKYLTKHCLFFSSHLKMINVMFFLTLMLSAYALYSQDRFIFEELDHAILEFYTATDKSSDRFARLSADIDSNWKSVKKQIENSQYQHFDKVGFVKEQDNRIQIITRLVSQDRILEAQKEVYVLLKEFQEVRECIPIDDYDLDVIIEAYDTYLSVHEIIHDEMMGLYEWTEFIWFVDDLKCKVEAMGEKFGGKMKDSNNPDMKNAYIRLEQCLSTLDKSLVNAYTPDFELPCDDLKIAFMDLIEAYIARVDI